MCMAKTFQVIKWNIHPEKIIAFLLKKCPFVYNKKEILYKACGAWNSQIAHQGSEAVFLLTNAFMSL